jgi:hypothetical protein
MIVGDDPLYEHTRVEPEGGELIVTVPYPDGRPIICIPDVKVDKDATVRVTAPAEPVTEPVVVVYEPT